VEGTYSSGLSPNWHKSGSNITPEEEVVDVFVGSSSQKITVTSVSENNSFYSDGITLTQGKTYMISFAYKVLSGSITDVRFNSPTGGWWTYPGNNLFLNDNEWTEYNIIYNHTQTTQTDVRLVFFQEYSDPVVMLLDGMSVKEIQTLDSTPNSNNGVLYQDSNIYTTDRQGQANKAMEFNGTSDYVYINNGDILKHDNTTISLWFKESGLSTTGWLLRGVGSGTNRYYLYQSTNGTVYMVRGANSSSVVGSGANDEGV